MKYYDEEIRFKEGNAEPKRDVEWIVNGFKIIFKELSSETRELFELMVENNLMDLETKTGKAGGAFATYLCDYKFPYIFANLTGTRQDIKTLAHEFGHAFQMYISNKDNDIPEGSM